MSNRRVRRLHPISEPKNGTSIYETVGAAQQGVARYLTFYKQQRPHRAFDGKTPDQVYCSNLTTLLPTS